MEKCAVIRRAPWLWCVTLAAVTGRGSRHKLRWSIPTLSAANCRIERAIIRLLNINTAPARTCPPTFGSQGSQATQPDDCAARVTSYPRR